MLTVIGADACIPGLETKRNGANWTMEESVSRTYSDQEYYASSYHGIVHVEEIFSWHWERFCREKQQDSHRYTHLHLELTRENCIRSWALENAAYPVIVALYEVPKTNYQKDYSFKERRGMIPKVYRGPYVEGMLMWKGDFISWGGCLWIARKSLISKEPPNYYDERFHYFSSKIGLNEH